MTISCVLKMGPRVRILRLLSASRNECDRWLQIDYEMVPSIVSSAFMDLAMILGVRPGMELGKVKAIALLCDLEDLCFSAFRERIRLLKEARCVSFLEGEEPKLLSEILKGLEGTRMKLVEHIESALPAVFAAPQVSAGGGLEEARIAVAPTGNVSPGGQEPWFVRLGQYSYKELLMESSVNVKTLQRALSGKRVLPSTRAELEKAMRVLDMQRCQAVEERRYRRG